MAPSCSLDIHPCILPFKRSHTAHGWILFHFTHSPSSQLLSHHFHCCSCFSLALSPLIFLNHPSGENRSLPQSGTNCFVRFTNPEPNPDKRTLVKAAVLFVFARITDCAVIRVFIVQLWMQGERKKERGRGKGPWSLTAHQSCHKNEAGAKWQEMLWAQMIRAQTATDKKPLL